jgi:hypothetical protein
LRAVSPVASNSRAARSAKVLDAHPREHLVGDAQLLPHIEPQALPAQPLAVEEMRASELRAHADAPEPLDRFAVEVIGGLVLAQ